MKEFFIFLKEKMQDKGQGMVEYGILLAFVLCIAVAIYSTKNSEDTLFGILFAFVDRLIEDIHTAFNW